MGGESVGGVAGGDLGGKVSGTIVARGGERSVTWEDVGGGGRERVGGEGCGGVVAAGSELIGVVSRSSSKVLEPGGPAAVKEEKKVSS